MERMPESEAIAEPVDARRFNEAMSSNRFRLADYRRLARKAVEMGIPPGGKVLDLGTGPGFAAIEIARLLRGTGCHIVGMDLSRSMLTLAAENAAKAGLDDAISWREGDAKSMPFDDGGFDCIVSNDSLHHWEDPLTVFDEISRVLKESGRCLIHDSKRLQRRLLWFFVKTISLTIPRDFRVHWWNSIRSSYTADELRAILERSRLKDWRIEEDFMDVAVLKG